MSGHTDLCMWDRSLWGRPRQQQERLQGRKVSGIPVWSACPLGTAGRHRLGEVQTHLRRSHRQQQKNEQTYNGNSHRIFEEALIHAASCRVQSRFTWLRSAVDSLAEFLTKQFAIAPMAVHADVKDKYCGTTYFKCKRPIWVNKPFSFPRLVFLLQPLQLHFFPPFLCSVTFSVQSSPVCLFICLVNSV